MVFILFYPFESIFITGRTLKGCREEEEDGAEGLDTFLDIIIISMKFFLG